MDVQICYENFCRTEMFCWKGKNLSNPQVTCGYSDSDKENVVGCRSIINFRTSSSSSPNFSFLTPPPALHLDGNLVYTLPDHLTAHDFARFLIKDEHFCNQEEPFYVVDFSRLLSQHEIWMRNLPRVQPYYAVKCNDHKSLLHVLAALGCNFDCASKGEMENVLDLGVHPQRILYANPCKTAGYIKHAQQKDVRQMTFDNEHELRKIFKLYPQAELILRIAVSDPTAVCPLNLKFGAEPEEIAPHLLKVASAMGANVIGISFHVGSGCRDPSAFALGIRYARQLFDLGLSLGYRMNVLDLGGGFPGYESKDGGLKFETITEIINRSLDVHFPEDNSTRIIAEPGRFYAASCFTLCCTIVAKTQVSAERVSKNENDRNDTGFMYYINDGVYGSFNCILYDHVTPTGAALFKKESPLYTTAVWGPTCDSLDLVQPNVKLPEMEEGDWMVFDNMGAYTCAAGSEFNGFPRPTFCYIVSQSLNPVLNALLNGAVSSPRDSKIGEERIEKFFPKEEGSVDNMTSSSADESDSSCSFIGGNDVHGGPHTGAPDCCCDQQIPNSFCPL